MTPAAARTGLFLLPSEADPRVRRWLRLTTHFASGTNRAGEVQALAAVGQPIGLAAPEVTPAVEAALYRHVGAVLDVFVDSGAFSEVEIDGSGPPKVVRPMTDEDWHRVLDLYRRMSQRFGESVHVVAPDRVGDQEETLRRLRGYRTQLLDVARNGGEVLIPLQRGSRSASVFYEAALRAIDPPDDLRWHFSPAIPYKKAATADRDVVQFVAEVQPARIHLLGGGERAEDLRAELRRVSNVPGGIIVRSDSNLTRAMVGRTNGPGGGPRRLTAMSDRVRAELPDATPDRVRALAMHRILVEDRHALLTELDEAGRTATDFKDAEIARHAAGKLRAFLGIGARMPAPPPSFRDATPPVPIVPPRVTAPLAPTPQLALFKAMGLRFMIKSDQLTLFGAGPASALERRHVRGHRRSDGTWVRDHVRTVRVTHEPPPGPRSAPTEPGQPLLDTSTAEAAPSPEPAHPTVSVPDKAPTVGERLKRLFDVFAAKGAPGPGERGYKAPGHDGRTPEEVASTATTLARRYLGDPDFHAAWSTPVPDDPHFEGAGYVDWDAYDEGIGEGVDWADATGWTSHDLPDLLELPRTDGAGAPYSRGERIDLARQVTRAAMETHPEYASGSHLGDLARQHGLEVPEAVVDAVIADWLHGTNDPTRRRIVLVDLDTAEAFVERHHSAFPTMNRRGLMYAIGLEVGGQLVAVATAGTPTGRWKDPHGVLELTRIASDGSTRGASSALCARLLDLLPKSGRNGAPGRLFVTYSLTSEDGSTYKALREKGLRPVAVVNSHGEDVRRIRWEAGPDAGPAAWELVERSDT